MQAVWVVRKSRRVYVLLSIYYFLERVLHYPSRLRQYGRSISCYQSSSTFSFRYVSPWANIFSWNWKAARQTCLSRAWVSSLESLLGFLVSRKRLRASESTAIVDTCVDSHGRIPSRLFHVVQALLRGTISLQSMKPTCVRAKTLRRREDPVLASNARLLTPRPRRPGPRSSPVRQNRQNHVNCRQTQTARSR